MQRIQFGIRYRHIELLRPLAAEAQDEEEEGISLKHWVLVFTPPSKSFAFTIEAMPSDDAEETICTPVVYHNRSQDAFPLGTFYGEWDDLIKILEVHPQRASKYSPCFNNCQHFVATFLLFLQGLVSISPKMWIKIEEPGRYAKIREVLRNKHGIRIWNACNIALGTAMLMPIPIAGVATAGAVVAAETTVATTVTSTMITTVATTVPAGGIAGLFGGTTVLAPAIVPITQTVMIPASYSAFAAFCAPLAMGCVALAGASYLSNKEKWKRSTSFDNPSMFGFPIQLLGPLTVEECSLPRSSQGGKSFQLSSSSADANILISLNGFSVPAEIEAVGASYLHQIASGIWPDNKQVRDTGFVLFFSHYHI
jgi:hypothetical protein